MATFEPWARGPRVPVPKDARVARLFGAVEEPEPLDHVARERVRLRLQRRNQRRSVLMLLRLVAVGVVLGVAGAAAAQWTALRWLGARPEREAAPVAAPTVSLTPQPVLPRRAAPRVESEIQPLEDAPAEPAPPPVASAPLAPPVASVQSSRLGLEASSLEAALSALRGGAPARALAALDRHLREFPNGALELEARVAHVDALLLLGRRDDARRELGTLPLERVGRKQELRLIRAELEAEHDCGRALSDFRALSSQSLPAAWAERALFGRGACSRKLGDEAGAARDFALYLERYPNGRFAAQLRAAQAP